MTSPVTSAIREQGFRKWYQRELTRGHVHLLLLLLCVVAALGALEALPQLQGANRLLIVASLLVALVIGAWAGRRYLFHLTQAEFIARQAVCPRCRAYARWRIEHEPSGGAAFGVRCSNCDNQWQIDC